MMGIKDDAKKWTVKEQIIEDPVSGLTLQFEVIPESTARYRLRIFGHIPHGNREIIFDIEGEEAGSGTVIASHCKPTWLTVVDD